MQNRTLHQAARFLVPNPTTQAKAAGSLDIGRIKVYDNMRRCSKQGCHGSLSSDGCRSLFETVCLTMLILQVKRTDELSRKMRFFTDQVEKSGVIPGGRGGAVDTLNMDELEVWLYGSLAFL